MVSTRLGRQSRVESLAVAGNTTPKLQLIERIEKEFETLCLQSGVKEALEKAREEVILMEMGHAALLGRFINDDNLERKKGSEEERKRMGERNCGPRAIGAAGSDQREWQLAEWEKDAEERSLWDLEKNYISPKGIQIGTEDYRRWFLGVEDGKSFLYSANATANPNLFDIGSHNAQQAALRCVKETEGKNWENAEFDRVISDVLLALREPQTKWERSPGWVKCSLPGCGGLFLAKDKNAEHRCKPSQITPVMMVTKEPAFVSSYLRVNYPSVSHLVTPELMEKFGWVSAPASQFLVDELGAVLPEVPKGIRPDLVKGIIWYQQKSSKHPGTSHNFRLAMAVDVAIKEASEGAFGPTPYSSFETQPWEPTDPRNPGISRSTTVENAVSALTENSSLVKVTICKVCSSQVNIKASHWYQHSSCGVSPDFKKTNASQSPERFHTYSPKRFIDLPYANTRVYAFMGLALKDQNCLAAVKWELACPLSFVLP